MNKQINGQEMDEYKETNGQMKKIEIQHMDQPSLYTTKLYIQTCTCTYKGEYLDILIGSLTDSETISVATVNT